MLKSVYPRLAATNIKKNHKLYLPYLLACIGTVMMFFIMLSIANDPVLNNMSGGADTQLVLRFGTIIIGIFSIIILFYTNSVITKNRKKEFGLYNILGMEKRHIGRVLFLESIYTYFISMILGIALGMVFSKLMQMLLKKMLGVDIAFAFKIDFTSIGITVILFAVFFVLIFLNTVRIIKKAKPVDLLNGAKKGEKEPKSNWIIAIIGAVCLIAGYTISILTKDAVSAILLFFVAVILVIIGTYMLFTAFSIILLKTLRKNKKYYYKTSHFATVSGMLYRMKRNAAGLASICILSSMVLVTVSTTGCLYVGIDDIVDSRYKNDINVSFYEKYCNEDYGASAKDIEKIVNYTAENNNLRIKNSNSYSILSFGALYNKNGIQVKQSNFSESFSNKLIQVTFTDKASYENLLNKKVTMGKNDILCFSSNFKYAQKFTMLGKTYNLKYIDSFPLDVNYVQMCYFVVNDKSELMNIEKKEALIYTDYSSITHREFVCDLTGSDNDKKEFAKSLNNSFTNKLHEDVNARVECKQDERESYFSSFGSFLFLGLFLGFLFVMATVLIIYYKQISEGYDDREHFEIMQKVGMTEKEVRSTIKSQVLIVFFLPLITAAIHIAFAFPMVRHIMAAFGMMNVKLFVLSTIVTFLAFAVLYFIVYTLTAKAYYSIVSKD